VLDEEEQHPSREKEEDELGERVGGVGVARGVHHGRNHEQRQRRSDRVTAVEPGPDRVGEIGDEQADKDRGVGDIHRASPDRGWGLLSIARPARSAPSARRRENPEERV